MPRPFMYPLQMVYLSGVIEIILHGCDEDNGGVVVLWDMYGLREEYEYSLKWGHSLEVLL